jgi:cyclopropane-fatty-acyl-phospholipid synthase
VARVPSGRSASRGADRRPLFRRAAARLPLRLAYPDGTVIGAADPTLPTMVIHHPNGLRAGSADTA